MKHIASVSASTVTVMYDTGCGKHRGKSSHEQRESPYGRHAWKR